MRFESLLPVCRYAQEVIYILSMGIDTHERMHYVKIRDERQNVLWHGRFENTREGLE